MKKCNIPLLFALVTSLLLMNCEKENMNLSDSATIESRYSTPTAIKDGVSIQDGRFVFETIEDFEEVMYYLEDIDIDSFIQTLSPHFFESFINVQE